MKTAECPIQSTQNARKVFQAGSRRTSTSLPKILRIAQPRQTCQRRGSKAKGYRWHLLVGGRATSPVQAEHSSAVACADPNFSIRDRSSLLPTHRLQTPPIEFQQMRGVFLRLVG